MTSRDHFKSTPICHPRPYHGSRSQQSCEGVLTAPNTVQEKQVPLIQGGIQAAGTEEDFIGPRTCTVWGRESSLRKIIQNPNSRLGSGLTSERPWCLTFLSFLVSPCASQGKSGYPGPEAGITGGLWRRRRAERPQSRPLLPCLLLKKPFNTPASVSPLQSGGNMLGQREGWAIYGHVRGSVLKDSPGALLPPNIGQSLELPQRICRASPAAERTAAAPAVDPLRTFASPEEGVGSALPGTSCDFGNDGSERSQWIHLCGAVLTPNRSLLIQTHPRAEA